MIVKDETETESWRRIDRSDFIHNFSIFTFRKSHLNLIKKIIQFPASRKLISFNAIR